MIAAMYTPASLSASLTHRTNFQNFSTFVISPAVGCADRTAPISHRKTTVAACERGIVLEEGQVTETGPLKNLAYFRTMAGDPDG